MAHIPPSEAHTPATAFERLLNVLVTLRTECPWDKKQTMESLRHLTIEEMYELADAILEENTLEIKKELGDLMMHLVFYARIAEEQKHFDITDVLNAVCEKLISRHPHIYGNISVKNEEEVKKNWEQLKLKEGSRSVLSGVPNSLPALVKAYRIQDKVRGVGFDWEDKSEVWGKVEEELNEFKEAYTQQLNDKNNVHKDVSEAEAEFGDLLFSLINFARHLGINPENALERTNKKFIRRFEHMEEQVALHGKNLRDMNFSEMDHYWEEAKRST